MLNTIITTVSDFLWGWPLIIILFGTHIFMTIRTGFVQKDVFKAIKLSVTKDPDADGNISQFGALTTALSSTIGTGNIVGVGTAIALGGPGAIVWMWLTGLLGMATKYAETLVAVKYRVKGEKGDMIGGAMYVLDRRLHMKWLGIIFAILAILASFGIGSTVQANAITTNVTNAIPAIPAWAVATVVVIMVALVIVGGIRSITKVAEKLVPLMAVFYILGCLIILVMNRHYLGETVMTILNAAFQPRAAGGGFIGSTIMAAARFGTARGLFSNESGMGSAPLVASAAKTRNPKRQALVSMTGTFWDTVVICLLTGLVLVSTVIKYPDIDAATGNGGTLTASAFAAIPYVGTPILLIGLVAFAFTTTLGWYYYAERCIVYLFGEQVIVVYKIIFLITVFAGALAELKLVWSFSELTNGLMALPNIVAILWLSKEIAQDTKKYKGKHIDDLDDTEIPVVKNAKHGVLHIPMEDINHTDW